VQRCTSFFVKKLIFRLGGGGDVIVFMVEITLAGLRRCGLCSFLEWI